MKKRLFLILVSLISLRAFSQTSGRISEILAAKRITCGQLAYLVGAYRGIVPEDDDYDHAFEILSNDGFFAGGARSGDSATLGQAARAIAKGTNLKGGIFYRLTFGNERYAMKELKAMHIIPDSADSTSLISGRSAVGILTELDARKE